MRRRPLLALVLSSIVVIAAATTARSAPAAPGAAPGTVDPTWNGGRALAVGATPVALADGSVVMYRTRSAGGGGIEGAVMRRFADGRRDWSYGGNGVFRTDRIPAFFGDAITGAAPFPGGGVVLAGPAGGYRLDAAGRMVERFAVAATSVGVDAHGTVSLVIDGAVRRYSAGGAIEETRLDQPRGIAVAPDGAYATCTGHPGAYRLHYRGGATWSIGVGSCNISFALASDSLLVCEGTKVRRHSRVDGIVLAARTLRVAALDCRVDRAGRVLVTTVAAGRALVQRYLASLTRDRTFGRDGTTEIPAFDSYNVRFGGFDRAGRIVVQAMRFEATPVTTRLLA